MTETLILVVAELLGIALVFLALAYREPPEAEAMRRLVREATETRAAYVGTAAYREKREPSDAR